MHSTLDNKQIIQISIVKDNSIEYGIYISKK